MGRAAPGVTSAISSFSAMVLVLSLAVPHAAQGHASDSGSLGSVEQTNTQLGMVDVIPVAKSSELVDSRSRKAKTKKTKVTLSGGTDLRVRVTPRLPKKRQYKFTLSRLDGNTWRTIRTLKTRGKKTRQRVVKVGCGHYRVKVHKRKGYRTATSKVRAVGQANGRYVTDDDFVSYIPQCWDSVKRKQAIVTFSPSGQDEAPGAYGNLLRDSADKHGLMILGWKHYRNSTTGDQLQFIYDASNGAVYDIGGAFPKARSQISSAIAKQQLDKSRVLLMGMSGGGSFAHALNILYPELAAGVVVNTAMIWGEITAFPGGYNGSEFWEYMQSFLTAADYSKSRKQAIFFESETDFRYPEMLKNAELYREKGWTVRQVRFAGGHKVAPKSLYDSEIARFVNSDAWKD